jgi:hypothetical protein
MKVITSKYERTCVRCKTTTDIGERVELISFGVAHLDKDCLDKLNSSKLNHPAFKN